MSWLETYRGMVYRWEVDHNDHLTVAYYFARIADAGLGLLEALGLGAAYMGRAGRGCVTTNCYVRYQHELRVGDLMHVESGVIGAEPDGLLLGHKVFNSESAGRGRAGSRASRRRRVTPCSPGSSTSSGRAPCPTTSTASPPRTATPSPRSE